MGVYTAINRNRCRTFFTVSLVGISLPTFLIGILLIFLFPVTLHMCPRSGAATWCGSILSTGFTASGLKALVLRRSRSACSR